MQRTLRGGIPRNDEMKLSKRKCKWRLNGQRMFLAVGVESSLQGGTPSLGIWKARLARALEKDPIRGGVDLAILCLCKAPEAVAQLRAASRPL